MYLLKGRDGGVVNLNLALRLSDVVILNMIRTSTEETVEVKEFLHFGHETNG